MCVSRHKNGIALFKEISAKESSPSDDNVPSLQHNPGAEDGQQLLFSPIIDLENDLLISFAGKIISRQNRSTTNTTTASRTSSRTTDKHSKLVDFQHYFNAYRTHAGLEGRLAEPSIHGSASAIDFGSYRWRSHCRGLYQTPIAA